MEMDSLERLRSFMIAFSTVRRHHLTDNTDEDLHASQVAEETHKQHLMALDVIKVKAPVDVMAVKKLRNEGWMGTIEVVAWPYSPDDERIRILAYTQGVPVANPYES
ncbi:hypothetical protein ABKV19_012052 [Rosa sericea]